jgi:hypothetical protein
MESIAAASTGPEKTLGAAWTHWNSVPERFTPSSRSGLHPASTSSLPTTRADGAGASRQTGAVG